jgi:hypothetical protein
MRRPQFDTRLKVSLNTKKEFYDQEFGWVHRLDDPCPKCNREGTMAMFEDMQFMGCTHCLFTEPAAGHQFTVGGYTEARKILETINNESRVEKPVQPIFHKLYMKRNGPNLG